MSEKSRMKADWISRVWKGNPCTVLANGDIRTGPVRLAFCHILERQKPGRDGKERAYGAVLLFPDDALLPQDFDAVLRDATRRQFAENAPAALKNPKLVEKYHNPFKSQDDFLNRETGELYDGFGEGRLAISANSSKSQPYAIDQNGTPLTEARQLYSGCWALAVISPSWIKREDNPGPTFYLQGVVVVADDESLGGAGAANPQAALVGLKIDPLVNPAAMFEDDDPLAPKAPRGRSAI